jgi:hypothetical protein
MSVASHSLSNVLKNARMTILKLLKHLAELKLREPTDFRARPKATAIGKGTTNPVMAV